MGALVFKIVSATGDIFLMDDEKKFLNDLHDKYYAKKKRRARIKEEEKKQMFLFDDDKRRLDDVS